MITAPSAPSSVLLVDDDELVARGHARLLTSRGYRVTIASSAEEAAQLLPGTRFEAVVSDIMMPGGGGMAMLRSARAFDEDLPVILVTGAPTVESAIEAVGSGATKYLMKPLERGGLEAAVAEGIARFRLAKRHRDALVHSDELELASSVRVTETHALDGAVNRLWMAYQPIISWSQQRVFAFEALVRSDETAFASPATLVAAAEKLGKLDLLGRAVRASVAAMLSSSSPDTVGFVNLHAQDLFDPTLFAPDSPLSALAPRVVLEITERASIDEIADLQSRVAELRRMGFRIAIDDLGAGYAGLTSIAQLKPDIVKLDMSLVRGVATDQTKRKLIGSMVNVCQDLGILVVAEGVETVEERDVLLGTECDLFQGYLFARPGRELQRVAWEARSRLCLSSSATH